MVDAPTPNPPINLKIPKTHGLTAKDDPIAEIVYNNPIKKSVFFLPYLSLGIAPRTAPKTVPHNAEPTMIIP